MAYKSKPAKCAVCESMKFLVDVRERKPGARGRTANSFAARYPMCMDCVVKARKIGAVEEHLKSRTGGPDRVTVLAKTFAWLKNSQGKF